MVLIIHHNDLDGWTAAKIIEEQESKKEKVRLLPFNYGDEVPDIANYSRIYVLDLSLNAFPNLPLENVVHIDHHNGPISSKTVLCKSSVTKFCWEWFHDKPNPHIDTIDNFDLNGPEGNVMYKLGISQYDWQCKQFWSLILRGDVGLFDTIIGWGEMLYEYLASKEKDLLKKAPIISIKEIQLPLLQGPIETLTSNYIAYQTKNSIMDFKIQHPNAPNLASFYGGSGHGNVGGFTKPLKEGLGLLQNWL